jgi:hypothetical protein
MRLPCSRALAAVCHVLVLAGGCRSGPAPAATTANVAPTPADFPAANAVLSGFDEVALHGEWRAGDELLFGIRLTNGGERRHWLLHVRLTEPQAIARPGEGESTGGLLAPAVWNIGVDGRDRQFSSSICRALATVYDHDGSVLGRSEPRLLRDFLAAGFANACAMVVERRRALGPVHAASSFYDGVDPTPFAAATIAAIALLQVVQEDRVLAKILWEVVQKPSAWSVLANLGVRVTIQPRFHEARPVASPLPGGHGPAFVVPFALAVNDRPALDIDLCVVPSAVPIALGGGVVAATAHHPQDAGIELAMLLLAARRGAARGGGPEQGPGGFRPRRPGSR